MCEREPQRTIDPKLALLQEKALKVRRRRLAAGFRNRSEERRAKKNG